MRRLSRIKRATRKGRNPRLRLALRQCQACGKVINSSKSKEGVQREMGQTGIPHGVPSGNGMSLERASSCSHTTTLSIVIETERTVTLCVTADMALVTDRCDMAPSLDAYAHKPKLL